MSNLWKWTKLIMAGLLIPILVLTALTYTAGTFARSKLERSNLPQGQLTDVGNYNIHTYYQGEGNPTVILEGDFSYLGIYQFIGC